MQSFPDKYKTLLPDRKRHTPSLVFGFSVIVILMLLPIVLGLNAMDSMHHNLDDIILKHNDKQKLLDEMEDGIRKRQVVLRDMVLHEDPFIQDELRVKFYLYAAQVAQARNKLEVITTKDEEVVVLKEINKAMQIAYPLQNDFADDLVFNDNIEKITKGLNEIFKLQETVLTKIEELNILQSDASRSAVSAARALSRNSFIIVLSLALVSLLLAFIMAYYVISVIRKQYIGLENTMNELESARNLLERRVEERTQDLVEARDIALSAERSMSVFLSNMSHELRTPIHGILSFSAFGIKKISTADKDKLLQYFNEIRESSEQLLSLVNDLLDLSKLKAGKMSYDYKDNDFCQMVHNVVNELTLIANEKKLHISIDCPHLEKLAFDEERISQVVRNLLSNAIKFSRMSSQIDIKIEPNSDSVVFCITDEGLGIPENELEIIFDAFNQSSASKTVASGTGLGLSICKEIIEYGHMGRIFANSGKKTGASFTFVIPDYLPQSVEILT